jgi:hypothetical protein
MIDLLTSTLLCTSCFGNPSEGEAAGFQWAIFLLVGLVGLLQLAVARLLYKVVSRDHSGLTEKPVTREVFE